MFGNVAKTAIKWGAVIGTAAITVATTIGGMAINTAKDVDKAIDSYIVATGTAKEATGEYEEVLKNIYKNNYGEDFQDIADSMAQVKTQMGDLDKIDLQNVTENALALRDTFGYEVKESVRAAKMLMEQFGITSEEAFNLIAQGTQNGLDKNGDLLDSINEYSVHFRQIGLNATDMFNIFKQGADDGAFSIDKVGDAIKEIGIRMKDGSTTEVLQSMKLDANELEKAFAEGGEKGSQAFGKVVEGLKNIEDPLQRNQAGVAIFGTMWEDLGEDVIFSMTEYGEAFDETLNTMNQIKEVKYDNLSDMFQGLKRNVEMLTLPLGNALMPILQQIIKVIMDNMPLIEQIFNQLAPVITNLFTQLLPPLINLVQTIMPILFDLLNQIIPFVSQILETILPVLVELLNMILPPVMQIVQNILPIIIQLLQPILQLLEPLIQLLQPIIDLFMQLLQPLIQLINFILPPIINLFATIIKTILPPLQVALTLVANVISGVFNAAFNTMKGIVSSVIGIFQNIINFMKNVFTGNWKAVCENIKSIFSNVANGLGNIFKAPINFIIGLINGFIRGLNRIKIPDWVPGVGGFGINIREIPRLKVGLDNVPEDYFPAFLDRGERVLTKEENAEYNKNLQKPDDYKDKKDKKDSNDDDNKDRTIQIILQIENFNNNFKEDVRQLGEELAFVVQKSKLAKGGAK